MLGFKHSEVPEGPTKLKINIIYQNENNPMYGLKHNLVPEGPTRKKMSEAKNCKVFI